VYLLIGGNLGDRLKLLQTAKAKIAQQIGVVERESSIYETEAWGFKHDQFFLNQLLDVKTEIPADQVLSIALEIEDDLGRKRIAEQVSGRTMDIDILFYDNLVLSGSELTIPHPRLHLRRFALAPLNEIAENLVHPTLGKSMGTLMKECTDKRGVAVFVN